MYHQSIYLSVGATMPETSKLTQEIAAPMNNVQCKGNGIGNQHLVLVYLINLAAFLNRTLP